jgi:3-keto-disaccharide hydrolase
MKKSSLAVLLLMGAFVACSTTGSKEAKALFNGRNLAGWVVMHGGEWTVENGVLTGRNGTNWSTNPEKSGSWLSTEKQYGNFILELEYAINQGGNSGIFFRSAHEKNPAFTGYEMQVVADPGREPTKGSAGSLYAVVPAKRNMSKPAGEWNQVKIVAEGRRVQIFWNGELTIDHETDRALKGYLGLQNHDAKSVVKFRDIRITEL